MYFIVYVPILSHGVVIESEIVFVMTVSFLSGLLYRLIELSYTKRNSVCFHSILLSEFLYCHTELSCRKRNIFFGWISILSYVEREIALTITASSLCSYINCHTELSYRKRNSVFNDSIFFVWVLILIVS